MHRRTAIAVITSASIAAVTGSTFDGENDPEPSVGDTSSQPSRTEPESAPESDDARQSGVGFDLAPYDLSRCGPTCGEASTALTNTGDEAATEVHVTVELSVEDDLLWETDEHVGRLEAGATVDRTERVELGFGDLLAIRENDDRVTVTTIIESDQVTDRIVREKEM